MSQIIQHNIMSLNSYNRLSTNNSLLSKNLEKLSSGYKINRAGDDAAGLAISEKMRAQITGLERASDNAQDGISLVQTAEGALTEVHSMLNRMVELATQSANGTYDNSVDRANLQKEITSLKAEVNRIAESTNFNGINLLDGSMGAAAEVGDIVEGAAASTTVELTNAATTSKVAKLDTSNATIAATNDASLTIADSAATKASFEVDLSDARAIENGKTYDLTVSGVTVESAATSGTTAAALATAFDGKTFTIGGVAYTAKADEDKLTFEAAAGAQAKITNTTVTLAKGSTTSTAPTGDPSGNFSATNAKDGLAAGASKSISVTVGSDTWTGNITSAEHTAGKTGITLTNNAGKGTITIDLEANSSATSANIAKVTVTEGKGDTQTLDFTGKTGAAVHGASITVNDKTYEFVKTGETAKGENAIAVEVADDADAAAIATALKTKIADDTEAVADKANLNAAGKFFVEQGTDANAGKLTFTGNAGDDIKETLAIKQEGIGLGLQIGDTAEQRISVKVADMGTKNLGIDEIDIGTEQGATDAIATIKTAINTVSSTRADLGAIQNRLEYTINNLATTTENLTSAESRIRDTDMAKEMMAYTKNNVLSQAAQAMLAQANQQPQQILQLLQ